MSFLFVYAEINLPEINVLLFIIVLTPTKELLDISVMCMFSTKISPVCCDIILQRLGGTRWKGQHMCFGFWWKLIKYHVSAPEGVNDDIYHIFMYIKKYLSRAYSVEGGRGVTCNSATLLSQIRLKSAIAVLKFAVIVTSAIFSNNWTEAPLPPSLPLSPTHTAHTNTYQIT